jgi:hypothetical protein
MRSSLSNLTTSLDLFAHPISLFLEGQSYQSTKSGRIAAFFFVTIFVISSFIQIITCTASQTIESMNISQVQYPGGAPVILDRSTYTFII